MENPEIKYINYSKEYMEGYNSYQLLFNFNIFNPYQFNTKKWIDWTNGLQQAILDNN